ncbi:MAG: ISNCY family transposase [Euryarchaeota archaeon]|nr:ISNCY family transposase [Euryarchaeota archaeon]
MIKSFRLAIQIFPDKRTGKNLTYTMEDIVLSAFSLFFIQSPSFLAFQRTMKKINGISNAETLFKIEKIPTDNHIRDILDIVHPERLFSVFDMISEMFKKNGYLNSFRGINRNLLIALDGTRYFSSDKIHCKNCSEIHHKDGTITYYHSAITPVIVAPGQKHAISLFPEFSTPQDGYMKQDSEIAAAKRWIYKYAGKYVVRWITILGDDLYSRQPFCEELLELGFHFILVCKQTSHKTLYKWVDLLESIGDLHVFTKKVQNGRKTEIHTYRYANKLPIRDTDDALMVNWCELTIRDEDGKILYKNAVITDHRITAGNVKFVVRSGRARWKIENENNNTLKTKGYHIEHNYGHGDEHLSTLLLTLNILAFLIHTLMEFIDEKYRLIRATLPTRKMFFDDVRALTRYICFGSWDNMMDFMLKGLEIDMPPNQE